MHIEKWAHKARGGIEFMQERIQHHGWMRLVVRTWREEIVIKHGEDRDASEKKREEREKVSMPMNPKQTFHNQIAENLLRNSAILQHMRLIDAPRMKARRRWQKAMRWCIEQRKARMDTAMEEVDQMTQERAQAAERERRQHRVSASTRALTGSQPVEIQGAGRQGAERGVPQRRRQGQVHVRARVGRVVVKLLTRMARAANNVANSVAHMGTGVRAQRSGIG